MTISKFSWPEVVSFLEKVQQNTERNAIQSGGSHGVRPGTALTADKSRPTTGTAQNASGLRGSKGKSRGQAGRGSAKRNSGHGQASPRSSTRSKSGMGQGRGKARVLADADNTAPDSAADKPKVATSESEAEFAKDLITSALRRESTAAAEENKALARDLLTTALQKEKVTYVTL